MLIVGILLFSALQTQGDLKLSFDKAVYPGPDSGALMELYYDIPYTSLVFLKQDTGFAARFSVGAQLLDRHGSPVAGDIWQKTVVVSSYGTTIERDSSVAGFVGLRVPDAATRCAVEVTDFNSDRTARASFDVQLPESRLLVRMLKSGQPNPSRTYRLDDTVEAKAEILAPGVRCDSFRFLVKDGRRVVTGATVPASGREAPAAQTQAGPADFYSALFTCPVADSAGAARLSGSEYGLEVTVLGFQPTNASSGLPIANPSAKTDFRVVVPFFLDDEAYRQKVDNLLYVATSAEIAELRREPPASREQAWNSFWKEKDPTPTTSRNEKEEEYFTRVEYAEEHFGGADKGLRSDRGRIYILYGPPDNIDSRPFEIDSRAYEVWYYYDLGLEFTFVDRYGFGEFVLSSSGATGVR